MRTNIEIDDDLIREAVTLGDLKTKKATVEEALREFVAERRARRALKALEGIGWDGDLEELRKGWEFEDPNP